MKTVLKLRTLLCPGEKLDEFGDMLTKAITGICVLVWVMSYQKFFNDDGSVGAGGASALVLPRFLCSASKVPQCLRL